MTQNYLEHLRLEIEGEADESALTSLRLDLSLLPTLLTLPPISRGRPSRLLAPISRDLVRCRAFEELNVAEGKGSGVRSSGDEDEGAERARGGDGGEGWCRRNGGGDRGVLS